MTNPEKIDYATTTRAGKITQGGGDVRKRHMEQWTEAIQDWTDWLHAAGKSRNTIRLRRYQLMRIAMDLEFRTSPWKVTTDELIEWTSSKDWSTNTRRTYRDALRTFYAWAKLTGRIKKNPAEKLPSIRA
ncbi:MAG: hypothetical protein GEU74_12315, partial [Nitriliruptorales bacterium]|nr:hypothetical protein [Nitriliruptorales bacterium]